MPFSDEELKEIARLQNTTRLGGEIQAHDETSSTNDLAKNALLEGSPEGTVFVADTQTAGRGRQGRSWHSEPGTGLYFSLILTPPVTPENAAPLTLVAGVAVVRALASLSMTAPTLKWPNDVLVGDKKVAGILSEWVTDGNQMGAVVGIGINVGQTHFPNPINQIATSLQIINGDAPNRIEVLAAFLKCMEEEYESFLTEGLSPALSRWSEHSQMWDRPVTLLVGNQKFSGNAQRLDAHGGLVVLLDSGEEKTFDSGEVTLGTLPYTD